MNDTQTSFTPCYVSYVTFKSTIHLLSLDGAMPRQIDRTVLTSMGGSTQKMFLGSLRFFELIDDDGVPSARLRKLSAASDSEWPDFMQVLLREKYGDLIEQLPDATPKSLRDEFVQAFKGIGASLIEPAIRFLIAAAKDCDMPVSSHLVVRKPRSPRAPRKRQSKVARSRAIPAEQVDSVANRSPRDALIDKFPSFDPSWDKDQQNSWFSAFQKLVEIVNVEDRAPSESDSE